MIPDELKETLDTFPEEQKSKIISSFKAAIWIFGIIFLITTDFIYFRIIMPHLMSAENNILVLMGALWAVILIAIHIFLAVILFIWYSKPINN